VEADPRVQGFRLQKSYKESSANFTKCEVRSDSEPLDLEEHVAYIHRLRWRDPSEKR
jgi:hypothetical protein